MQAFNGNSSLSPSVLDLYDLWYTCNTKTLLKDGIFETGAYGVPSKSQNPAVLGQGKSNTKCSNPSWAIPFNIFCASWA